MTDCTLGEIAEKLNSANAIAVVCHVRPDGDALGSGLALCLALQKKGKRAYMLCEDEPPQRLCLFPAMRQIYCKLPVDIEQIDLFVSVDSADINRIGAFASDYSRFKGVTINIDHHVSNTRYGKMNYVVDCTATCEIMPSVLSAAGLETDKDIANLLALGLLTDSGNFSHRDVSPHTFEVAALLAEKGADICDIGYEMFSRQTKGRAVLYGKVISGMRFALDDKLVFLTVTQEDFKATDTDKSQTEGFVDFPLTIDGVEVSAAVMEVGKNQYKVSLRSRAVNVNAIASAFGGGGHILASGCMLFGEYEEVIDRLTYAVYQHL